MQKDVEVDSDWKKGNVMVTIGNKLVMKRVVQESHMEGTMKEKLLVVRCASFVVLWFVDLITSPPNLLKNFYNEE